MVVIKKSKKIVEQIYHGDCLEIMKSIPDCSVHGVICDPPYELGFMGKSWDNTGIAYTVDMWAECYRVLKPGGHILAFGGSRTQHRMAVAIEDAGFEMMNCLGWIFGSGFPKATDVSKQIDKRDGAEREVVGKKYEGSGNGSAGKVYGDYNADNSGINITAPSTPLAKHWDGYKYSISPLKPALEIIIMARKPFDGKPLDSIIKHEIGAINVDGCRISVDKNDVNHRQPGIAEENKSVIFKGIGKRNCENLKTQGRYPPNLVIDKTGAEAIGRQSGECPSGSVKPHIAKINSEYDMMKGTNKRTGNFKSSTGTAARYFPQFNHDDEPPFLYCPKVSKKERNKGTEFKNIQNNHPTLKPLKLMKWLVKLITRENQIVLDPFGGSGTTGIACLELNRKYILIEKEKEYFEMAKERLYQKSIDIFLKEHM